MTNTEQARVWNYRRSLIVASRCEGGQSLCSQNFANEIFLMLGPKFLALVLEVLSSITRFNALLVYFYNYIHLSTGFLTFRYFQISMRMHATETRHGP